MAVIPSKEPNLVRGHIKFHAQANGQTQEARAVQPRHRTIPRY